MLSLEHDSLQQAPKLPMKAISFEMVCKLREPLVLVGAKSAFNLLESGCAEYFVNVKKQAAEQKRKIGRVADSLNGNQLEWCRQAINRLFNSNDSLSTQLLIGPMLPTSLLANAGVCSAFSPQFWCSGPHGEVTNFEQHCFGSIRTVNAGSRTVACVNFDLWFSFVRSNSSTSGSAPPTSSADVAHAAGQGAGQPFMSLASQNMLVTAVEARKRFRNLSSDAFVFVLFQFRVRDWHRAVRRAGCGLRRL